MVRDSGKGFAGVVGRDVRELPAGGPKGRSSRYHGAWLVGNPLKPSKSAQRVGFGPQLGPVSARMPVCRWRHW